MARILITSGPTRQYLDPVRYISNASSGMMGRALAQAALSFGHEVFLVSGPVAIQYPKLAQVQFVETTGQMLDACRAWFPECTGLIGAAAPCDYEPARVSKQKLAKNGHPLHLKLIECPDIVATLGRSKRASQWTVGFALESEDARFRAIAKLQRKLCDLVVVNGIAAINSNRNQIEIINPQGEIVSSAEGTKAKVARHILQTIGKQLIERRRMR